MQSELIALRQQNINRQNVNRASQIAKLINAFHARERIAKKHYALYSQLYDLYYNASVKPELKPIFGQMAVEHYDLHIKALNCSASEFNTTFAHEL